MSTYHVRKTLLPIALTWPHIIYLKKKTNKQTKITYHTLHQYTLRAFLTLLSKVLEREIIQIKLAVVLDMGQRDDITKLVNVGLHANKTM